MIRIVTVIIVQPSHFPTMTWQNAAEARTDLDAGERFLTAFMFFVLLVIKTTRIYNILVFLTNHDDLIPNPAKPLKSVIHTIPHPPTLGESAQRDHSKQVCERQHSHIHTKCISQSLVQTCQGPSG